MSRSYEQGGRIERLATDLERLARVAPEQLAARVRALGVREQAELALRLPAAHRLQLLLHAPLPMRLVRSLPDFELYLTLREVGPSDGLPLVALASAEQITHLLDLESWRGDRFDAARSGAWVALLLDAGEPTMRRFLRSVDIELLSLLFQQWMCVREIVSDEPADIHGTGETEAGDERGIVSPDGHYRFSPVIPEHAPAVARIAQILYRGYPRRYDEAIQAALRSLPSELEEEALHWRESRLEEHGFPPPDEARSVYAAPSAPGPRPAVPAAADADALVTPIAPLRMLDAQSPLLMALRNLPDASREQVLHELLSVANKILVADGADIGDPASHRVALETGAGYVGIALEARGLDDPARAAAALAEMTVLDLFREGHAKAADLQQRARRQVSSGWAAAHPLAIELLDPPIRERVRALVEARPLYVEIAEDGSRLRGFRSLDEIEQTRVAVETARVVGGLLVERLRLDVGRFLDRAGAGGPARLSTLLLTMLAWHTTRGETRAEPLPEAVVADFLRTVASRRTAAAEAPLRALEALVAELAGRFDLAPSDRALFAAYGRACLERLAAECATLDPGVPLDRRAVSCLVVAGEGD